MFSTPPPFSAKSQIQPASLDLTIGDIWIPEEDESDSNDNRPPAKGSPSPQTGYKLEPGRTVLIVSKETIKLAPNLAAFGFPPARMSRQGLLMTNPGHVDPGYSGHMHFTVINMGRETYSLRQGDPIVSLLLFSLEKTPEADFGARHTEKLVKSTPEKMLEVLAHDFLSVEKRAKNIAATIADGAIQKANTAIASAELGIKQKSVYIPISVALIAALGSIFVAVLSGPTTKEFQDLRERFIKLETQGTTVKDPESALKDLRERLVKLETVYGFTRLPDQIESLERRLNALEKK